MVGFGARVVQGSARWGAALGWGQGVAGRPRAGWASFVRTPCLHSSKHPIRSQRGGNNGQTPGEIGFRAPLFWVQVLVRLLLASECPARANAELADNFRAFFRRQKTAARRRTLRADSGRGEASPAKIPRDTPGTVRLAASAHGCVQSHSLPPPCRSARKVSPGEG